MWSSRAEHVVEIWNWSLIWKSHLDKSQGSELFLDPVYEEI